MRCFENELALSIAEITEENSSMNCTRTAAVVLLVFSAGCANSVGALRFESSTGATVSEVEFRWADPNDAYLQELRRKYALDQVVAAARNDYERVLAITHWAHQRWVHSATHAAIKDDPSSILEAAARGEQFRCTEYSIVAAGALNALGIPARIVFVETSSRFQKYLGIGSHVVAEAFLADQGKWTMLDGQWDAVPLIQERPLNAVEFQEAIVSSTPGLHIASLSGTSSEEYLSWIAPYLYSFTVRRDARFGVIPREPGFLSLVPSGASQDDERFTYTSSPDVFYQRPPPARVNARQGV